MRTITAVYAAAATLLLLVACKRPEAADAISTQVPPAASVAASAGEAMQSADTATPGAAVVAHYTIAGTTVPLRYVLRLPDEDGKLRLLLAPDELSAEEAAEIRKEAWVGASLMSKRTAQYSDRYPFVVLEIRTYGTAAPEQVTQFYVMASSIAEPYHTDNINLAAHNHGVELLELQGDRVRLRASGKEEINGEARDWSFDLTS